MISVTFHGLDKAVFDLERAKAKAVPVAMRNALNVAAFEARRVWQDEIKRTFTTRNRFTERSIQVRKAEGEGRQMASFVGSTADYMATQEDGGVVRGGGRHKAIPGPVAAGLAPGANRTRLVRAGNRLSALTARKAPRGASRQQRNAIALAMARRAGGKVVLLERPKGGKGLFRMVGGRRRTTGTRLLWDVSRGSVRVPPARTLQHTLSRVKPKLQSIYYAALVQQLQRLNVLGY